MTQHTAQNSLAGNLFMPRRSKPGAQCDSRPAWSPPGIDMRSYVDSPKCEVSDDPTDHVIAIVNHTYEIYDVSLKCEIDSSHVQYKHTKPKPRLWEGSIYVPAHSGRRTGTVARNELIKAPA